MGGLRRELAGSLVALVTGCGASATPTSMDDAGPAVDGRAPQADARGVAHDGHVRDGSEHPDACPSCGGGCVDLASDNANCGACGHVCSPAHYCIAASCQASPIEHVVLIVEENHTFDSYFGNYCQAPAGSSPTCTSGPSCCEAAPTTEPHGASPQLLDDDTQNPAANFATDRDHAEVCELQEVDDGKMDGYVTGSTGSDECLGIGPKCASPNNWAVASEAAVGTYWTLASSNALADRYFQPAIGSSSSNDMYFAIAHYQFQDDDDFPDTVGSGCLASPCGSPAKVSYTGRQTIADLLLAAGKTFAVYADGFADAQAAAPSCAEPSSDCRYAPTVSCDTSAHPLACHACLYDPSDIPFAYYAQLGDSYTKDYAALATDITSGALPSFAFVKAASWRNEHPNVSTIADGVAFVTSAVGTILASQYASSTLILVTWDEGGGFFDHVSPPAGIDTDDMGNVVPYGTRVPLIAIGPFAKKGDVSHVTMEHSSIVKFLEYNFLGSVGQLGYNDGRVNNLGSLLDPAATKVPIPVN